MIVFLDFLIAVNLNGNDDIKKKHCKNFLEIKTSRRIDQTFLLKTAYFCMPSNKQNTQSLPRSWKVSFHNKFSFIRYNCSNVKRSGSAYQIII